MSTQITTVYDAIVTRVSALLPSHKRLTDAYNIEQNNEQFLNQGWCVAIGNAANGDLFLSAKLTYQRNFIITITRKYYAREFDYDSKATTEKELMEDVVTVVNDFTADSTLNGASSHVKYLGDSGIQKVFGEKDQFLKCEIEIQSTIIENL